ncbi:MAG TPA: Ig-like domain-containing protein [Gemmatimonadales bacterium]
MHRLAGLIGGFGIVVAAALVSCGGDDLVLPGETSPAEIAVITGNNQRGPAGQPLRDSLVVRVRDRRGQALPNARVAFKLEGEVPGASISPDTAETGAEGMAHARWVLGSAGGTQSVVAAVVGATGLVARFEAEVGASAARIERAGGDGQRGSRGAPLANPLVVRVTDGLGNPVAGVTVEWSTDDGSVDPASSQTGSDGRAGTRWTLGSSAGEQTAEARSAGLEGSPLAFTATASGEASRLVRVSGNGQSARPGDELDDPLVVRVEDQDGNGVPGQPVSWVVATGGGSVSDVNSTTDENGRASIRWTLGPEPGGNSLNAVVSGIGAVGFSATATGGDDGGSRARQLAFRVQPSDTEEDERISPPVEVVVLDQDGNRVSGGEFRIKLDLTGDRRGKLKGDREERTVSGVATFNDLKVDREGDYRLRASTDGLPSVESDEFEVEED